MKRKKQTLLWTIKGEGLPAVSYLFGTMHVRDARAFIHLAQLEEALRQADAFAAEFHLSGPPIGGQANTGAMHLPDNTSLEGLIRPKRYKKLRKILLKTTQLDIHPFRYSIPFVIVNLLGTQLLASEHHEALDEFLWNLAKGQGKSMQGIETFSEQMSVLEKIPIKDQVKMLLDLGKNISGFRRHIHHLIGLYQQGEVHRLFKTVKKNSKGLRHLLLYKRNEVMAGRIAALAAKSSVFAAIGAGHLSGGKGVIRLLKKRGLDVKPVPMLAEVLKEKRLPKESVFLDKN